MGQNIERRRVLKGAAALGAVPFLHTRSQARAPSTLDDLIGDHKATMEAHTALYDESNAGSQRSFDTETEFEDRLEFICHRQCSLEQAIADYPCRSMREVRAKGAFFVQQVNDGRIVDDYFVSVVRSLTNAKGGAA